MSIELIVAVSDIHAGSTVALMPPGFTLNSGQTIGQNPLQEWLWASWLDATQVWAPSVVGKDQFVLTVVGDAIEGDHHRTSEIISSDTANHLNAAIMLLKPLSDMAAETFIVKGTECHTKNSEEALGQELDAFQHEHGLHATNKLYLEVNGCLVAFHHHISTTSRAWLEASALSIHLANEQVKRVQANQKPPRVLVTGHRHEFGEWHNANAMTVVLPPWQGLTRFGWKVVPSSVTRPGVVIFDWRGLPPDSIPRIHVKSYLPAQQEVVKV